MENEGEWVESQRWFHSIAFSEDTVSAGRFAASRPPNYTLFGAFEFLQDIDVQGLSCLDIGTMDGIVAFILKKRGAASVIATDMAERPTFHFGRKALDLDIEYRVPAGMDDLGAVLEGRRMDLIVMAGVLYHTFDPMIVLSICRESLENNGLLILETQYVAKEAKPVMSFTPAEGGSLASFVSNTFWRPSHGCLRGMLEVAGFHVLGTIAVNGRLTVLAQARKPSEIAPSTERIKRVHEVYMSFANYGERVNYRAMESDTSASAIRYTGPQSDRWIYASLYRGSVPFHPGWHPSLRDRLRCLAKDFGMGVRTVLARPHLLRELLS